MDTWTCARKSISATYSGQVIARSAVRDDIATRQFDFDRSILLDNAYLVAVDNATPTINQICETQLFGLTWPTRACVFSSLII